MICKKCMFFKTKQGKGKMGECRRFPPKDHVKDGSGFFDKAVWPDVKPTQWCGEFRPAHPGPFGYAPSEKS
jgi:hypothetical protein